MPGSFKAEAVVLRSIRFGEADRVLHLYTAERGRVGAIAKGVRRVRSRLGGRLEPLSRVRLVLHQGRGELCTISQADPVHAYNLHCHELHLLDAQPAAATRSQALAFRAKLLIAAGFAPELASCASCGETEHLGAFSPSAGGVVCASCEAGSFPLAGESHAFLVAALGRPLAEAPEASDLALAQADRAIAETAEFHAHVRLSRVH